MHFITQSIRDGKSQASDRQKQKTLGRTHRSKFHPKRKRLGRTYRTGREVSFKGLTLMLWNEDINRLGAVAPRLAMALDAYAFGKTEDARRSAKSRFWNDQKGDMKRDFERASNILEEIHGGRTSAEGRVFLFPTV